VLPGDLGLALQAGEDFEDDLGLELRREGPASAFENERKLLGGQYRLSYWSSPRGALQVLVLPRPFFFK
jgi:hypothetical protein